MILWPEAALAPDEIGAGDRLPAGCEVLVIVLLSLLLWAILLILLGRSFDTESVADFRETLNVGS